MPQFCPEMDGEFAAVTQLHIKMSGCLVLGLASATSEMVDTVASIEIQRRENLS